MLYFNLHKGNIDTLLDFVKKSVADGEDELQILYGTDDTGEDDIMQWEDENFEAYKNVLSKVSDFLIEEIGKEHVIHFNVLTNLILNQEPIVVGDNPAEFLFCKHCVCTACIPDQFLFKNVTNMHFIPPVKFCRRSFVEYEVGRSFMAKVVPSVEMIDMDYKEFLKIIFRMYGNELGIGEDNFGI